MIVDCQQLNIFVVIVGCEQSSQWLEIAATSGQSGCSLDKMDNRMLRQWVLQKRLMAVSVMNDCLLAEKCQIWQGCTGPWLGGGTPTMLRGVGLSIH